MVCNTGVEGVWTCQCTDVTDMFCCALLLALGFPDVSFFAFLSWKVLGLKIRVLILPAMLFSFYGEFEVILSYYSE